MDDATGNAVPQIGDTKFTVHTKTFDDDARIVCQDPDVVTSPNQSIGEIEGPKSTVYDDVDLHESATRVMWLTAPAGRGADIALIVVIIDCSRSS